MARKVITNVTFHNDPLDKIIGQLQSYLDFYTGKGYKNIKVEGKTSGDKYGSFSGIEIFIWEHEQK